MSLKFSQLNANKNAACYSGSMLTGKISIILAEGQKVMMDKEGIIVEVDGFEQVKVKGSTKEMKAGIFPVRTPRALVGRNVDSGGIFTKEDLELTSSTTLAFKIALPVKLSSSYVCEYETHEVRVEYVLKAETTLEGVKIYLATYMFAAADWFHPEPREVEKTFSIDTFSEKSVTKCFCMVKKRLQKSNEEVNFKLSYTPCVEMGKELGCSLTVSRDIINDQTTLSVMVAEVVHVSETDETIIWPIERKFLNRRFEVKRPDFNHDGSLFSRHYCLVVEITGAQKRELLAELTLLEPKVFNLISSLSKNEISEPEVFKVLPPLDYEYETMY